MHYVELEESNGKLISRITKDLIHPEVEYWSTAVYCSLLGANPPFAIMNGYFRRIWSGKGIDKIMKMGKGLYLVRFQTKEDKDMALQKEYQQLDRKPIVVQEWTPDFDTSRNRSPEVLVWVRFPHQPL